MDAFFTPPLSGIQEWHGKSEVKNLIVMLHGFNSSGDEFSKVSEQFSKHFQNAYVVTPNGPICDGDEYRWFNTNGSATDNMYFEIEDACSMVNQTVDYYLNEFNLTPQDVFYVGFSQGAIVALHSGLTRNDQIGGILSFSGQILNAGKLSDSIRSRPPILLVHGANDSTIPVEKISDANSFFMKEKISVKNHICRDLGHNLNKEALVNGLRFLSNYMEIKSQ
ncbi:MAG: dienelactone hydrolase family protein [Rhodospirillales bacterium]|jgi:phospholipase/carboxylesterase